MSICMSICLHVCLSVCLSVCLYACLSVCLSVCLYACLSVCLSVCPSIRPSSIRPSIYSSIHPSIYVVIRLFYQTTSEYYGEETVYNSNMTSFKPPNQWKCYICMTDYVIDRRGLFLHSGCSMTLHCKRCAMMQYNK
jgi:hypothetical protein